MSETRTATHLIDAAGSTMSGLCLVHCLALPALVAAAPILAPVAENETLHIVLVALATPLAVLLISDTLKVRGRQSIALQAFVGLGLLLGALFVPALEAQEVLVTTVGGLLLAGAHVRRWIDDRRVCRGLAQR